MEGMNEAAEAASEVRTGLGDVESGRVRGLVAALRSGSHQQATRYLATESGGFCCLGVACEVAMENGFRMSKDLMEHSFFYTPGNTGVVRGKGSARILPLLVAEWFGFRGDPFTDGGHAAMNPMLAVPTALAHKYAQARTEDVAVFGPAALRGRFFQASVLNDQVRMALPDIGECFQYTFLREDWEAEHGEAAR